MKVFFVYAIPEGPQVPPDLNAWPAFSPYSITANLGKAISQRWETQLFDLSWDVPIPAGPGDVLIGHPFPDSRACFNRAVLTGNAGAKIAIFPLHHALSHINAPFDPLVPKLDRIIGITGKYWFDTWGQSAFAHWLPKIVRLDMAIDVARFPRVKKRFNPPGKRKFLFIGNSNPEKGTHLLSILFGLAPQHRCVWVGSDGRWPHFDHRPRVLLDERYMTTIADECDIFLTAGMSDANPTTILESWAWGFPVCCTPQSGYYNLPQVVELSTTDMKHNLAVLDRMQNAPEAELMAQANDARRMVETEHTFERFNACVLEQIDRVRAANGL